MAQISIQNVQDLHARNHLRLATFYQIQSNINAYCTKLAAAGFRYTGIDNIVQCDSCGISHDVNNVVLEPADKIYHKSNCIFSIEITTDDVMGSFSTIDNASGFATMSHLENVTDTPNPCLPAQAQAANLTQSFLEPVNAQSCYEYDDQRVENLSAQSVPNLLQTHQVCGPEDFLPAPASAQQTHQDSDDEDNPGNQPVTSPVYKVLTHPFYPAYILFNKRLDSFSQWGYHSIHKPHDLATAGFFYAGYADCVRCFQCGLGLKSWKPGDNVYTEHEKHRPTCPFLQAQITAGFHNSSNTGAASDGGLPTALMLQYLTRQDRERSFLGVNSLDCLNLATLGFFYKGYGDSVQCFSCGLSLRKIQACDVNAVHKSKSPSCAYLRTLRDEEIRDLNVVIHVTQATKEKSQTLQDISLDVFFCKVCKARKIDIVILPCNHVCICSECCRYLADCVVCGIEIEDMTEVYFEN